MTLNNSAQIANSLSQVITKIIQAEQQFKRLPNSVHLLAVSKTRSIDEIMLAIEHGQQWFGESYVQEAIPKIEALRQYSVMLFPELVKGKPINQIEWHFIGPVQSNKTRLIAQHFDWIHSLDNVKHAQRLNDQRPDELSPLNICIQVNISEEPQKSGVSINQLADLAHTIVELPRLKLRGLMTIPAYYQEFEKQREPFHALYTLYKELQEKGFNLDTLSMGMTEDMIAAIAEGATLVRIGTGIFGTRSAD